MDMDKLRSIYNATPASSRRTIISVRKRNFFVKFSDFSAAEECFAHSALKVIVCMDYIKTKGNTRTNKLMSYYGKGMLFYY